MRIDKFLKVSRVIKRRTLANEACETGRVTINDKVVKPGAEVKEGDIVTIRFGSSTTTFRVDTVAEHISKDGAKEMYTII